MTEDVDRVAQANREHPVDPADADAVEAAIDEWRSSDTQLSVAEFLGWPQTQLNEWWWSVSHPKAAAPPVESSNDEFRFYPQGQPSPERMRRLQVISSVADEVEEVVRAWRSLSGNSRNVLFDPRRGFDPLAARIARLSERWPL